jgi:small subunit ribosomal protein S17
MTMKAKEVRGREDGEIRFELGKLEQELFGLKFRTLTEGNPDPAKITRPRAHAHHPARARARHPRPDAARLRRAADMSEQTQTAESATRGARKALRGRVVSDKMDKTITVEVVRSKRHPLYRKIVRIKRRFYAHDEANEARVGDVVEILSTRPLSKLKRWRLVQVLARAPR